jgi:hypothetical protein
MRTLARMLQDNRRRALTDLGHALPHLSQHPSSSGTASSIWVSMHDIVGHELEGRHDCTPVHPFPLPANAFGGTVSGFGGKGGPEMQNGGPSQIWGEPPKPGDERRRGRLRGGHPAPAILHVKMSRNCPRAPSGVPGRVLSLQKNVLRCQKLLARGGWPALAGGRLKLRGAGVPRGHNYPGARRSFTLVDVARIFGTVHSPGTVLIARQRCRGTPSSLQISVILPLHPLTKA